MGRDPDAPAGVRAPDEPLFEAENIVKHFPVRVRGRGGGRRVHAVDGVSVSIRRNEVLGLVGESGCGKSTLARIMLKLVAMDSGSVRIGGRDISSLRGEELRRMRRSMQLIFQDSLSALDPRMRIGTSLEAPLAQHGIGTRAERRERVLRMLAEVGLDEVLFDRLPGECSGGQLQRAAIARALLLEPSILICDEPTSSLDSSVRAQVLNLLIRLKSRFDLTILMISHDLRVIRYFCDRVAVMYLGQIVEIADRDTLFSLPAHPYTRALIAASFLEDPELASATGSLRGEPPSPVDPPRGCRFHPRCPVAEARCSRDAPDLSSIALGHRARCHFPHMPADLAASNSDNRAPEGCRC